MVGNTSIVSLGNTIKIVGLEDNLVKLMRFNIMGSLKEKNRLLLEGLGA
jgi:hypothetical protein